MKVRLLLFLAMLAPAVATAEYVEIWSYAFITRTTEPISGNSGAIFKPDGDALSGPLYSQSRERYRLTFSIQGATAAGVLVSPKGDGRVELTGTVNRTPNPEGGCLLQVHLANGIHQVVMERLTDAGCAP